MSNGLLIPNYNYVRDTLVQSIDYFVKGSYSVKSQQKLRFLATALIAGVLSEKIRANDQIIYFLLEEVAHAVKKVYNTYSY